VVPITTYAVAYTVPPRSSMGPAFNAVDCPSVSGDARETVSIGMKVDCPEISMSVFPESWGASLIALSLTPSDETPVLSRFLPVCILDFVEHHCWRSKDGWEHSRASLLGGH